MINTTSGVKIRFIILLALMLLPSFHARSSNGPYTDTSHYSHVFGHNKYYRLYLPKGYDTGVNLYPVIYFFHGWGGRHFKDDNALLEYDMIGDLVDKYQVILVMWDGNMEESEPRPYNIGNHKDIRYRVQMKDYFTELVSHVDTSYRTFSDRNHRGIIGFSMGGIMSFFLAGKYPHRICAAVNLAGTPEFFIGYPENHTLYPVRYTFKNLMEVPVRQHGGDTDILVYLNEEVRKGAAWEGNPYEFYGFSGGHMIDKPNETTAFDRAMKFVTDHFGKGIDYPEKWSHYDLYGNFEVWDYQVTSDKNVPGFIFLRNVTRAGFGLYTHKWLPGGPPIDSLDIEVTTAPHYSPGKTYHVIHFSPDRRVNGQNLTKSDVTADNRGEINLVLDGDDHEIGIYADDDPPEFVVLDYTLNDQHHFLTPGDDNQLTLTLFNRGGEILSAQKAMIKIETGDYDIQLPSNQMDLNINPGDRVFHTQSFRIACHKQPPAHGEPFQIKFKVTIQSDTLAFTDDLIIPVLFNVPEFKNIKVDDGLQHREKAFGRGNGNGQADAGEQLLLYEGDHRLRLYTNDRYVISEKEVLLDEQLPSVWEDGFALSSVITIAGDCPDGHVIVFTACYEINTFNPIERNVHWGKVAIRVHNQ
jgi:enterochelin esterase-like enzyme